jgi:hypothetical protein
VRNVHDQRAVGSRSITIKVKDPGSTSPLPLPPAAGAGHMPPSIHSIAASAGEASTRAAGERRISMASAFCVRSQLLFVPVCPPVNVTPLGRNPSDLIGHNTPRKPLPPVSPQVKPKHAHDQDGQMALQPIVGTSNLSRESSEIAETSVVCTPGGFGCAG